MAYERVRGALLFITNSRTADIDCQAIAKDALTFIADTGQSATATWLVREEKDLNSHFFISDEIKTQCPSGNKRRFPL